MIFHRHGLDMNTAYITIDRQKLPLVQILDWLQTTCQHYIGHRYHGNYFGNDLIDIMFSDSDKGLADLVMFKLRWL